MSATTPALFSTLLGQPRAKNMLSRTLQSERIGHAYLFRGPAGVGKKLFALEMAKAINCRELGPGTACNECFSCKKYLSGNHPDFIVESPERGAIKIDAVRELCKKLTYAPYESRRRVIVLEDVHTMRAEAANSLLKTLEEPPRDNVLILTAETSQNVLSTILSRCQVIPFFPLTAEETVQVLVTEYDLNRNEATLLARLSEGSPGAALLLKDADMVPLLQEITAFLDGSGKSGDDAVHDTLLLAQKMADMKDHLPSFLGLLRIWLRDNLDENREHSDRGMTNQKIFEAMKFIDNAFVQLARNCNRSLVCEILLFRLQ